MSIPDSVLGLTVLAWGNSIGDLSTNMAMAKKGLSNMAITVSLGAPNHPALSPPLHCFRLPHPSFLHLINLSSNLTTH